MSQNEAKRLELVQKGVELAKILGTVYANNKSPMEAGVVGSLTALIQGTPEFVAHGLFGQEIFLADPKVAARAAEIKDEIAKLEERLARLKSEKSTLDSGKSVQEASLEEIVGLGVRALTTASNKIPGGSGTPWQGALGDTLYKEVFPNGLPQSSRGRKPLTEEEKAAREAEKKAEQKPAVRVNGKEK